MQPIHRFGTMGWNYEDWRGEFYAKDTPVTKFLSEFSQTLSLVELDSTFYAVPKAETLEKWAMQTPDSFLFTAKLPKNISHERRLVASATEANAFAMLLYDTLDKKCGGVLLQLPPDFATDEQENLYRFLEKWEQITPLFIEFRHFSWKKQVTSPKISKINLESHLTPQISIVTTERVDLGFPIRYLRLLGEENAFTHFTHRQQNRFHELDGWAERLKESAEQLKESAERLKESAEQIKESGAQNAKNSVESAPVFVFARNFYEGYAPATLFALMERLGYSIPTPLGQQQMRLF